MICELLLALTFWLIINAILSHVDSQFFRAEKQSFVVKVPKEDPRKI